MKIINKHKIGLLGGTFDPPHKGHLHISREAINILKLHNLYWSIANQNPLKELKPKLTINQRMLLAKKIIKTSIKHQKKIDKIGQKNKGGTSTWRKPTEF